jgi:hypothetical protein
MDYRFADRHEAGVELASHLRIYKDRDDVVVLALPRGGVPVAFEVAEALARVGCEGTARRDVACLVLNSSIPPTRVPY